MAMGVKVFSAVSVADSATKLADANPGRQAIALGNAGVQTVYLGGSGVTTATGFPLDAGAVFIDDVSVDAWYGIVASGTCDVRVMKVN